MNYIKQFLFVCLFSGLITSPIFSQVDFAEQQLKKYSSATPPHMWEVGLNSGMMISMGDIDSKVGLGAGFHVRKALDYVFSLRGDIQFGKFKGEEGEISHETDFKSGSVQMLMSVNNLVWSDEPKRKINMYLLIGAGMNSFSTSAQGAGLREIDGAWVSQLEAGAGMAFRVTDRLNIGLESKLYTLLGAGTRADLIDGLDNADNDIPTYTSLRVNYNIGNSNKKTEPLYWINPMDVVLASISELKARPTYDLADSDDDGVVDALDKEPNSPVGAPVDTRGRTLDSDKDGVPDYKDTEPYSPPGQSVDAFGVVIRSDDPISEDEKNAMRKIVEEVLKENNLEEEGEQFSNNLTDWFLPMIHFEIDENDVRLADYGTLRGIAKVMEKYPEMRLVVTGFTDKTASDNYNELLSYTRSKNTIDHLVNAHAVPRSRLILHYSGEEDSLVPNIGSSFMNRRVEFRVARMEDLDMEMPK